MATSTLSTTPGCSSSVATQPPSATTCTARPRPPRLIRLPPPGRSRSIAGAEPARSLPTRHATIGTTAAYTHSPTYPAPRSVIPASTTRAALGRRDVGASSRYAIGILEHHEGRWNRRDEPMVQGDGTRPSALEPLVVHDGDRYVMWYVATPHEVGRGEQPDYELRTTTSDDGLTGWTPPRVWAWAEEGFFDNAVVRTTRGWTMVLAEGPICMPPSPSRPRGCGCPQPTPRTQIAQHGRRRPRSWTPTPPTHHRGWAGECATPPSSSLPTACSASS